MKARFKRFAPHAVSFTLVAAASALGCAGEVMVGDVDGMGGNDGGDGGDGAGTGGSDGLECPEQVPSPLAHHARWKATANDFGDLAGSHWVGALSNGLELDLTITEDHQATLQAGQPIAPPMQNAGYIDPTDQPLPVGALYEIHGAGFDGTNLLVPLPFYAPYEEWCALQTPYPRHDSPCTAELVPGAVNCTGEVCTTDGRTVSASFVRTAGTLACACTLAECVANVEWPEWEAGKTYADYQNYFSVEALVLTYDSETDTLSGGLFEDGSPPDGVAAELERAD